MLPDILSKNLKLVICGTAAGNKSALRQAYYAGPGNKFYRTLFQIGLTPSLINPYDYQELLNFGIGLTDLVKCKSGMDHTLKTEHFDVKGFRDKMERYKPSIICFNGKEPARVFMGLSSTSKISYGLQNLLLGNTRLYVATSTSGAAKDSWDENTWMELKTLIG